MYYGAGADASTGTDWNIYCDTSTQSIPEIISANRPEGIIFNPKFVQGVSWAASSTSVSKAFVSVTTQGSVILVGFLIFGTAGAVVSTVTDSLNNTYSQIATAGTDPTSSGIWYVWACTNNIGGSCTVTVTGNSHTTFCDLCAVEYIGQGLPTPIDATATAVLNAGSSSTLTYPAVTTTVAGDTIVGLSRTSSLVTITPGAGYTVRVQEDGVNVVAEAAIDATNQSAGSHSTSASLSGASTNRVSTLVAIKNISSNSVPAYHPVANSPDGGQGASGNPAGSYAPSGDTSVVGVPLGTYAYLIRSN
jgi:hypothetical protein